MFDRVGKICRAGEKEPTYTMPPIKRAMTGVQNIIYTRIEEEKANQLGRKKGRHKVSMKLEVSQGMTGIEVNKRRKERPTQTNKHI